MTAHGNDPDFSSSGNRRGVERDLRQRNERRLSLEQILEARRQRQIERAVQAARRHNLREPRK